MTKLEGKQRNNDLKVKCEDYVGFDSAYQDADFYYELIRKLLDFLFNKVNVNDTPKIDFKNMPKPELMRLYKKHIDKMYYVGDIFLCFNPGNETPELTIKYVNKDEEYMKLTKDHVERVNKLIEFLEDKYQDENVEIKVTPRQNPNTLYDTDVENLETLIEVIGPAPSDNNPYRLHLSYTVKL